MSKRVWLWVALLLLIPVQASCGREEQKNPQPAAGEAGVVAAPLPGTPPAAPEAPYTDPLTGRGAERLIPLLAVVVDNLEAARPQSGLGKAGIVYEVEAEGLITRFLALYRSDPPEKVGPVRSARPYLVALAREWGAYLVHAGGSDDAYTKISAWRIPDLDSMRGGQWFSLDKTRRAPHNTYFSPASALQERKEGGRAPSWRAGQLPEGEPDYRELSFSFQQRYVVTFRWSPEQRAYLRFVNGEAQKDRLNDRQLEAGNIILQFVPHRELRDKLEHIEVDLTGRGRAEYFLGGRYLTGSWQKKDLTSPTLYLDGEGQAISMAPGSTWIEILRPGREVSKK